MSKLFHPVSMLLVCLDNLNDKILQCSSKDKLNDKMLQTVRQNLYWQMAIQQITERRSVLLPPILVIRDTT